MADEYIRRENALYAIQRQRGATRSPAQNRLLDSIRADIARAPAADVAEVVHGEWVLLDDCSNSGLYCSVCRRRVHREDFAYKKLRSKYCPHCGAKMDGGENDVSG